MKATVIREVPLPAAKLWAVIADFGNMSWAPGIDRTEIIGSGIGMIRRLHMAGLPEPIDEQLTAIDAATMTMHYAIPRGLPMPLDDYHAWARLEKISDDATRVHWEGNFNPRGISETDAGAVIEGAFNQLIDWISNHIQKK